MIFRISILKGFWSFLPSKKLWADWPNAAGERIKIFKILIVRDGARFNHKLMGVTVYF
jgi:hypothetical protein